MSYRFENTVGGKLVAGLREALLDVIDVDNSLLPESYRTAKGYRSLASIEQEHTKRQRAVEMSDHEAAKLHKDKMIAIYARRAERDEPLFQ